MRLQNLYILTPDYTGIEATEDYADSSLKRLIWIPNRTNSAVVICQVAMLNVWQPLEYGKGRVERVFTAQREYYDTLHGGAWYRPQIPEFILPPKRNGDARHPHSNDMYKWLWKMYNRRVDSTDIS